MARLWTRLKAKVDMVNHAHARPQLAGPTVPNTVNNVPSAQKLPAPSQELFNHNEQDVEAIDSAKARRKSQLMDELEADHEHLRGDSYLFGSVAHRTRNVRRSLGALVARSEEIDSRELLNKTLQREIDALRRDLQRQQRTIDQRNEELERLRIHISEIKAEVYLHQMASNQKDVALGQYRTAAEQMNEGLRAAHGQIRTLTRQLNFAGATNVVTRNETKSLLREVEARERSLEEITEQIKETNLRNTMLQLSNAHLRTEFEEMYSQHVLFMSHFEQVDEDELQDKEHLVPEQYSSIEATSLLDTTAI